MPSPADRHSARNSSTVGSSSSMRPTRARAACVRLASQAQTRHPPRAAGGARPSAVSRARSARGRRRAAPPSASPAMAQPSWRPRNAATSIAHPAWRSRRSSRLRSAERSAPKRCCTRRHEPRDSDARRDLRSGRRVRAGSVTSRMYGAMRRASDRRAPPRRERQQEADADTECRAEHDDEGDLVRHPAGITRTTAAARAAARCAASRGRRRTTPRRRRG